MKLGSAASGLFVAVMLDLGCARDTMRPVGLQTMRWFRAVALNRTAPKLNLAASRRTGGFPCKTFHLLDVI